ncbi:drug/metabolite transporter [Fomitopsis schrenkii]|uniref:Drug/metabolite transporter n=1 Tax=Fomitopsis schrenkii TaxID=2126942 RepID=S8FCV1_FOMSC|nr:drug/metabolite transporter [Fomitopsis schrenkii]
MAFAASRAPYVAQTPDVRTFGADASIPLARFDDGEEDDCDALTRAGEKVDSLPQGGVRRRWNTFASKCKTVYKNNIGLLLIAISVAFASMMSTLVKLMNSIDPPVPMLENDAVPQFGTGVFCMIYMWIMKIPDPFLGPKGVRWLLALRGFFGFIGLSGNYFSLQYLSVSDATVLQFLAPMCTGIAGALLLKEHFSREQAFASLFSLAGVVLIARPSFLFGTAVNSAHIVQPAPDRLDARFAMIGVFGATGAFTTIRAVGKRAHALHSVVAFSVQCVIASAFFMVVFKTPVVVPTRLDWLGMLLAIGFCGFIYQMLFTMGLQIETAGRGTMAVYVQVVYATINDFVFFHSVPNALSIIGTMIIVTSAVYIAVRRSVCP